MSFVDRDNVLALIENLLDQSLSKVLPDRIMTKPPFNRITYKEAMERYGSDKPDFRFGMEIYTGEVDIGGLSCSFSKIVVPNGNVSYYRNLITNFLTSTFWQGKKLVKFVSFREYLEQKRKIYSFPLAQ